MEETIKIPYANDGETRYISVKNACYRRVLNQHEGGNTFAQYKVFSELAEKGVLDKHIIFTLDKKIADEVKENSFGNVFCQYIDDINNVDETFFSQWLRMRPDVMLFDIDLKEKFSRFIQNVMDIGHDVIYF